MSKPEENQSVEPTPTPAQKTDFQAWLEQYYPEPASKFASVYPRYWFNLCRGQILTVERKKNELFAVRNSLNKWQGLNPRILEQHGVMWRVAHRGVYAVTDAEANNPLFLVDFSTCSLCRFKGGDCINCAICAYKQSLGIIEHSKCNCLTEYRQFTKTGNPSAMILLLQDTLKFVEGLETK